MTTDKVFVTPKEKLQEAVRIFRVQAKLHDNAPLSALVKHAHGSGKKKPGSQMVRDADHDYQHWLRRMRDAGQDPDAPTSSDRPFDPADVPQDPRPEETAAQELTNSREEDVCEESGSAPKQGSPHVASPGRRPATRTKAKPKPKPDDEEILY